MSLPSTYYNIYEYFDDALAFLKEYEWIYNFPNTEVLQGFLQKIPEDWRNYFRNMGFDNLRDIALQQIKGDCPQSFKIFLCKIQQLTSTSSSNEIKQSENFLSRNCGLSKKKKHEIEMLIPVVAELCEKTNSKHVIDIGAGSGHLSFMLANKYNYSVLAIEGCIKKIELAVKTERKFYEKSDKISFYHHFITEKSFDDISETIEKKLGNSNKICMYGLHACADLSAVILDLFLKLTNVKSLVIMPCCYHRLNFDKGINDEVYFKNFPLSDALKSMFEKHEAPCFLRMPFLRLACQQTVKRFVNMSENEHISHGENFMWRAVLQQAAEELDCFVCRLKRKMGQPQNEEDIFEYRLKNLHKTHTLLSKDITVNPPEIGGHLFKNKMLTIWKKEKENLILFEALSALQNSLQNLCESILLQDRVQFMKEKGVNCYIKQITDDSISPRCHALIAIKD